MKAVFLSYNQALTDRVNAILDKQGIRGFTKWGLDRGPRLGRRRTPLRHACVAFDERLDPGHRRRREGGSADGRLPRNGRCDQDAGVPGFCLEYRKRILIPLLAAHLPHISPAGRTDRTRVRSVRPVFHDARHLPRTDRNPGFVGSAIFGDRKPYLKRMRQCGAKNEAMHHKVPGIALFFLHLHP